MAKRFPQAVSSKRVILEAHNLFDVQNRRGVRVFFVRFVIREWNDETAVKILKNLSEASSSSTKLILVERTVTNWSQESVQDCPLQTWEILKDVKISQHVQSSFCHDAAHPQVLEETGRPLIDLLDSQLMLYGSGRERTLEELVLILHAANWKVEKISRPGTSSLTQLICRAIIKSEDEMEAVGGWAKKPTDAAGAVPPEGPAVAPVDPKASQLPNQPTDPAPPSVQAEQKTADPSPPSVDQNSGSIATQPDQERCQK